MLHLSRQQLREIDRRALADYHIPSIVLMENAARAVVDRAVEALADECCGMVLVLCGGGNNGGDGLAAARHLHNRGCAVVIALCCDPSKYTGDALTNWQITRAMNIPAQPFEESMLTDPRPLLIVDAIFGTGLSEPPRPPFASIADAVNRSGSPILSVDIPSGLDCDTGKPLGACIRAGCTVTFVAEKIGFTQPEARKCLGHVIVGDIGCPMELVRAVAESR
jgi:NAD(P)H-hydrate epimerase